MKRIRRWVYRQGFRPKPGSILYSPFLAVLYSYSDDLTGGRGRIVFKD